MKERLIKHLRNDAKVIFDKGKFDDYCVYVVLRNGNRTPPLDVTYFTELQNIAQHYYGDKVYEDFVKIYNQTNSKINDETLELIDEIVSTYQIGHQVDIEKWFTVIYAGMVAEENKRYAILKKRIKRLGMHQILMENMRPMDAANFSRGKKWRELDRLMRPKGF